MSTMKNKPVRNYVTGRIGCQHSKRYHRTLREAQARIDARSKLDPSVLAGKWFLDPMKEC